LAQSLLTLKEQFGITKDGAINVELTRQDLSSFAGATYETVFRTMNDLIADKLIALNGKSIIIVNERELFELTTDKSAVQ
jgi:CRP-like cAMP-binding protein